MTKEKELQNRTSRSADTRAKKVARKPWQPPSMLETPPAPEGYEYRWIRAEIVGQEDKKNVTARLREGFDLVRAEELGDFEIPTLDDGKHAGVVSVGAASPPRSFNAFSSTAAEAVKRGNESRLGFCDFLC